MRVGARSSCIEVHVHLHNNICLQCKYNLAAAFFVTGYRVDNRLRAKYASLAFKASRTKISLEIVLPFNS